MSDDMSQYYAVFFEECDELIASMEQDLLDLLFEQDDMDRINTVFRAAHSIKGGAATFGFTAMSEFTHVMETVMDKIREGEEKANRDLVDVLLKGVDCVRDMLAAVKDGQEAHSDNAEAVIADLQAILDGKKPAATAEPAAAATADEPPAAAAEPAEAESAGDDVGEEEPAEVSDPNARQWKIRFVPREDYFANGNDPIQVLDALRELGKLELEVDTSRMPALDHMDPTCLYLAWNMVLETAATEEDINGVFEWVEDRSEIAIEAVDATTTDEPAADEPSETSKVEEAAASAASAETVEQEAAPVTPVPVAAAEPVAPAAAAPPPGRPPERKEKGPEASSIRVGTDKLDTLINLVGELVITQSMFSRFGDDDVDLAVMQAELREGLNELERHTRELQEAVMRIRMVPISAAFNRVPRLIHDLSGKLGKKIDLQISGEQTELDKTVMEKIGDPLVHLVRNAVDHGLETPDVRVERGKPETGILELNAYHASGNIVVEIRDDGNGLDVDRIVDKARERGLVGADQVLSPSEAQELIFHPGFSTSKTVSDVSGRGVGMDVVRRNVMELGGSVEVASETGKGSTFTIRLPLTLAILDGQLVQVGDETYVVPLVSIIESIQLQPENLNAVVGSGQVYRLRDEYIQILKVADMFGIDGDSTIEAGSLLVVVESEHGKVGLVVDDLLAQQQVVIKSLETNYARVGGVSGATILGDGKVALILDVPGMVTIAKGLPQHQAA